MISVLLPTRGRPDLLQRCLDSIEMTHTAGVEVVLRIDDDDAATREVLPLRPRSFASRVLVGPHGTGYLALLQFFNECAAAAEGELFLAVGDDAIFRTPGWDLAVAAAAATFPEGLGSVAVNPVLNPAVRPHLCVTRAWVDALGFVMDPRLYWGDVFVRDVAQALGREIYLDDVVIEHAWAGGRRPEANHSDPAHLTDAYWARHRACVAEAVDVLRSRLVTEVLAG